MVSPSSVPIVAGGASGASAASGGPGPSALLAGAGLATDTAGNLYIVDQDNMRVRRLTPARTITTVLGTGSADEGPDGLPRRRPRSASRTASHGTPAGSTWCRAPRCGWWARTGWCAPGWPSTSTGGFGRQPPASLAQLRSSRSTPRSPVGACLSSTTTHRCGGSSPYRRHLTVPGAPVAFTATRPQTARLSWLPPSNGGSPLTGYPLSISPIGAVLDFASDQSAIAVLRPEPGHQLTFTLVAVSAVGQGPGAVSSPVQPFVGPRLPFSSWDKFITRQYQDFLGRTPTSAELALIGQRLPGGFGPSSHIDRLAHGVRFGDTYGPVARLYFAYFLRVPDQSGLDHWRDYPPARRWPPSRRRCVVQ